MYLHSGAVPVGPRSAGDVGQHGGHDRRKTIHPAFLFTVTLLCLSPVPLIDIQSDLHKYTIFTDDKQGFYVLIQLL